MFSIKRAACADQDEGFLQSLLSWFQHDNGDASNCAMLDMLRKLVQQQGVSTKLCSLGLLDVLHKLQGSGSLEVQRSANKTLTAVMQSGPALTSHVSHHDQASPHSPRSRCQSNSPPFLQSQELPQRSHVTPLHVTSSQRYQYKSNLASQIASQAFGSQEGKQLTICRASANLRTRLSSSLSAGVPSFSNEQHPSPPTAGSEIAVSHDEALARVRSRAEWRRQAQPTSWQASQEVGWTLRSISLGEPSAALKTTDCASKPWQ